MLLLKGFYGISVALKYFLETLKVVYYSQEVPSVRYVGWLILEIASLEKKGPYVPTHK